MTDQYAYVIITANGMGSYSDGADKCQYCGEKIEWDGEQWIHYEDDSSMCTEEVNYGYGLEDNGVEVEPKYVKDHSTVWNTIPHDTQSYLEKTDDTEYGEDVTDPHEVETKWVGWLNENAWRQLRDSWYLDPERTDQTMGMITEYGHMWALSETCDGMDWNMGGITPVDYVNIYYNSLDDDVLQAVGLNPDEVKGEAHT